MKEQADIAGMNFDDVIAYFMTILVVKIQCQIQWLKLITYFKISIREILIR